MTSSSHIHVQGGSCRPRPESPRVTPSEGSFPLHRLPNICCSSGACREVQHWPMECPQDGWLQLGQDPDDAAPVDLVAFSNRGVTVALSAGTLLRQGATAELLTHAHGAGLSHRQVHCCWQRPHPQEPERQLAGLRFVDSAEP